MSRLVLKALAVNSVSLTKEPTTDEKEAVFRPNEYSSAGVTNVSSVRGPLLLVWCSLCQGVTVAP